MVISMSLIHLLDNDLKWQEFLDKKKNSHLPKKVLAEYENFINNKKYKSIVTKIINNEYTFSTPKKVLIGKMGKSKKRTVYTFNEEENYVLKMLTFLLYKYDYLFSSNLYSFRKNSGVKKAIFDLTKRNKLNNLYGYKVDIKNYFNSIDVNILLTNLKNDLNDDSLYTFFKNILTNKYVLFNNNLIEEEKGVMAGTPIASFLANYYLKDLDKYFYDNNIIYARYADDIIVFDKDINLINNHKQYIINYLTQVNLKINPDKEYLYNKKEKFEFLGFSYQNGIIDLNTNTIKKNKRKNKKNCKRFKKMDVKKKRYL